VAGSSNYQVQLANAVKTITAVAMEYSLDDAYFVGGYPRAMAMGLGLPDVHDLDVASGSPEKAQELAGFVASEGKAESVETLHRTGTVKMSLGGVEIDFQGSASHDEVAPYVRLFGVPETPIAKNIFDRDFTMNALAIRIGTTKIIDMTKRGMDDISSKLVASIIPPAIAIPKNPLMITRAVRMAAKYGFEIEQSLWLAMKQNAGELEKKLSPERLAIEAFVLSKYQQTRGMLDQLGIKWLEAVEMVETGKSLSEE
jgi:tRNA nucleotidyltransferase/poly(A) polymerase